MIVINLGNYELDVSRAVIKQRLKEREPPTFKIPGRKHLGRIYMDAYYSATTTGLDSWLEKITQGRYCGRRVRILHAHGGMNDTWRYVDGNKLFPNSPKIEDWFEEWEGKYDALVVLACNVGSVELTKRKKPIVYPKELISEIDLRDAISEGNLSDKFRLSLPD
ncbi:MAG: hypothetical protein ACP5NS_03325 [Candidatus Pacearchaeota archaeon]